MSVATEITRIQGAKADLKTAINAKTDNQHQIDDETIDVYANFVDSIQTGGGSPTVGTTFSDWDSSGYPHTAQYGGRSILGAHYFASQNSGSNGITYKLENIILSNDVTKINDYAFNNLKNLKNITMPNTITSIGQISFFYCNKLELTTLPSSLTTLGVSAFTYCSKLAITQIPSGVTALPRALFSQCTSLKKMSIPSVTSIAGASQNGAFFMCSGLKQVWIGSAITSSGFERYVFQACNALEKIYIDLPRATVEAFTNYQYAFMNNTSKTGIIVCNDDSGWIDKATFDAMTV